MIYETDLGMNAVSKLSSLLPPLCYLGLGTQCKITNTEFCSQKVEQNGIHMSLSSIYIAVCEPCKWSFI